MDKKRFRSLGAVVIVGMMALIGWSIATENHLIVIPVFIGGVILLRLLRRQVRDIVEDERSYRIGEKASRFTIQVFALLAAIAGIILVALSGSNCSYTKEIGLTLAFSACALLILYMISYSYYNRKS